MRGEIDASGKVGSSRFPTKVVPPDNPPLLVSRPRLLKRLDEGCRRKLVSITAPTGYGKTTVLGEWAAACRAAGKHIAWLTLDADDDGSEEFWGYAVEALNAAGAGREFTSPDGDDRFSDGLGKSFLARLVSELSSLENEIALVLDGCQNLRNRDLNKGLRFFIERMPSNMHIIAASRTGLAMPMGELRLKGHVLDLTVADIAFDDSECEAYLCDLAGLDLSPASLAEMIRLSGGWPVGLRSLADSAWRRRGIGTLRGSARTSPDALYDYLEETVLSTLDDQTREFVMKTAPLGRVSAELCNWILGRSDSARAIRRLAGEQLFLWPDGQDGSWFRYHAQFAKAIAERAEVDDPAAAAEIHRRACDWFRDNGLPVRAVPHALALKRFDLAADILEEHVSEDIGRNDYTEIEHWMGALPRDLFDTRPKLWTLATLLAYYSGDEGTFEEMVERAERTSGETAGEFRARAGVIRALTQRTAALARDDLVQAVGYLDAHPDCEPFFSSFVKYSIARAEEAAGDLDGAVRSFERIEEESGRSGVLARGEIGRIHKQRGMLHAAERDFRSALERIESLGMDEFLTCWYQLRLCEVYLERGQQAKALRWAQRVAATLTRGDASLRYGWPCMAECLVYLADCYLPVDPRKAKRYLDMAKREVGDRELVYYIPITDVQVRTWLRERDFSSALPWAEKRRSSLAKGKEVDLADMLGSARVLIAKGRYEAALDLLETASSRARAHDMREKLVETLVAKAAALAGAGREGSLPAVEEAVALAQAEGYVRPFIDTGQHGRQLIAGLRSSLIRDRLEKSGRSGVHALDDYLLALEKAFDSHRLDSWTATAPSESDAVVVAPLVESLSERELEVLSLMCEGKSGPEIAEALVLTRNTVKVHIRNIYRKLQVHSRREAVACVTSGDFPLGRYLRKE